MNHQTECKYHYATILFTFRDHPRSKVEDPFFYSSGMVFKWRDEHTPKILDLLRNRECLWNNKCSDYKNKDARDDALQSLILDLDIPSITESDIKAKIKTIRTRYAAELAKVKKSEKRATTADNVYIPKLFWFQQADSFLRSVCTPRCIAQVSFNNVFNTYTHTRVVFTPNWNIPQ